MRGRYVRTTYCYDMPKTSAKLYGYPFIQYRVLSLTHRQTDGRTYLRQGTSCIFPLLFSTQKYHTRHWKYPTILTKWIDVTVLSTPQVTSRLPAWTDYVDMLPNPSIKMHNNADNKVIYIIVGQLSQLSIEWYLI